MSELRAARARRATWTDALLAAIVGAAAIGATAFLVRASAGNAWPEPGVYVLLAANAAPLAFRSRYPLAALLAVAATTLLYTWLGYPGGFYTIALVLAMWAAVAAGYRLVGIALGAIVLVGIVGASVVVSRGHATDPDAPLWLGGWLVASIVLGEVSRGRREYLEQVEQRAIDAERTREEEARRRAGEERLRIARELHDVLAHNISMINVQAGVAVHLLDRQPDQARTALVAISQASKEALRELRATLGVLRRVDEAEPLVPTPGLAALDELVARATATGLAVDIEVTGEARDLPVDVDLAAYRIIQESLTNAARHSGGTRVSVSIDRGPRDLRISVDDDGAGTPPDGVVRAGNGLTGMRERAAAAGGELEAGPRPDGGFGVRARLPIEGSP